MTAERLPPEPYRGNPDFPDYAVAVSRLTMHGLCDWLDERAAVEVLAEAERILKECTP